MKHNVQFISERGFTLIELLVTLGITLLLSTVLIVYSRSGERQIVLFKDQARIINFILRAKSLALQVYSTDPTICGYGVHFDATGDFLIFKDLASDCNASDHRYSGSAEAFEKAKLDARLNFTRLDVSDVIFIPPEPETILTPAQETASVIISVIGASDGATVKITNAGQVTTAQ